MKQYLKNLKKQKPKGKNRKKKEKNIKKKRSHLKVLVKYIDKDYAQVKERFDSTIFFNSCFFSICCFFFP